MTVSFDDAQTMLQRLAGDHAQLRTDQWHAIEALSVQRQRVLLVQRTGFGKSAVYFIATTLLRRHGAGATIIVSPLLALMRDQIAAAQAAGIAARTINSSNAAEWDDVAAAIAAGEVDVLLVSPERLNNPQFRDHVLPKLSSAAGMLVVDEAHCISDWGHDFRPDYRRLRAFAAELDDRVPVLATTATANARVSADIADQLAGRGQQPLVLRGSLDRESLALSVIDLESDTDRVAWLDEWLPRMEGSGIIYTLTVAAAEDIAAYLTQRGHHVAAYTGQTDTAERQQREDDLRHDRVKALVATSALGMGFDKPNLGFVVHVGAPSSPVAYYQQVGRAGRACQRADVVLLPGDSDVRIWRYFTSLAFPAEDKVRGILRVLSRAGAPMSTAAIETGVDLARARLEMTLKVLDVDGAVRRVKGGWEATGQQWVYDRDRYDQVSATRGAEQQRMREYVSTGDCRMRFLRTELDDTGAVDCGRCDNCAGTRFSPLLSDITRDASAEAMRRVGVVLPPRKMWPSAMRAIGVDLTGKISPDLRADPGRALTRLSDIGWGPQIRALLSGEDTDVDEATFDAVVTVLAQWQWDTRPAAVASLGSRHRPRLVNGLAARIARLGKMDYLGALERDPAAASRHGGGTNSAQRLRQVHDSFVVPFEVASCAVLLVDDLWDTGWSATVAAGALRTAGATAVYPLVLAIDG